MSESTRVVVDCNTFIQSIASDAGPAAKCMRLFESSVIEILISKPTLAELRQVLSYEEVRNISKNMTMARIDGFIKRLTFRATMVRQVRHFMDYPRDPDDESYIDLAITGKADYLISCDKDLLHLMTGHSSLCKHFRKDAHPLKILRPVEFLKAIGHPWEPPDDRGT